jgi:hypothetical protein
VTAVMSSSVVMRCSTSGSKIVTRMSFNSFDIGRIDFNLSRPLDMLDKEYPKGKPVSIDQGHMSSSPK